MARQLVAGLSPRKPEFDSRSVHVRLLDKAAPGHSFLRILRFYPGSIIPSILHTHLDLYEHPYFLMRRASPAPVVVCWFADRK